MKKWTYTLLTFYKFVDLKNPKEEVIIQQKLLSDLGIKGRIYLWEEWISATVSGNDGQLWAYRQYLSQHPDFHDISDIDIKSTKWLIWHCFDVLRVKYRNEIVVLGHKFVAADITKYELKLSVEELKTIIDTKDSNWIIRDMRNDYERRLGHFKNAIPSGTVNFKSVPSFIDKYKAQFGDKKVLMYCTGGIRCTKLSALLAKEGMKNIYGLDWWIVKYINTYDDGNWLGSLYVFDSRVSQYVWSSKTHITIAYCNYTDELTDNCENCRYGACNARITVKPKEYRKYMWFCSQECYQKAKLDLRIKDINRDKFDYQVIRDDIKNNPQNQTKHILNVTNYLDSRLKDLSRKHLTSQKEDYIDCSC